MSGRRKGRCANCQDENIELFRGLCSACYHKDRRASIAERKAQFPEAMEARLQKADAEQMGLLVTIQKCVSKLRELFDDAAAADIATISTIVQRHMVPLVQQLDKSREIRLVEEDDTDDGEDDDYHVYGQKPQPPPKGNPPAVFAQTSNEDANANKVPVQDDSLGLNDPELVTGSVPKTEYEGF